MHFFKTLHLQYTSSKKVFATPDVCKFSKKCMTLVLFSPLLWPLTKNPADVVFNKSEVVTGQTRERWSLVKLERWSRVTPERAGQTRERWSLVKLERGDHWSNKREVVTGQTRERWSLVKQRGGHWSNYREMVTGQTTERWSLVKLDGGGHWSWAHLQGFQTNKQTGLGLRFILIYINGYTQDQYNMKVHFFRKSILKEGWSVIRLLG